MTYYLGHAGALIALPDPESGLQMQGERIGNTHQLLSGARVRDTLGYARTWQLSWTAIDLTTIGTLDGLFRGHVGPGPYYLIDPEQRNLLTANVSSGTDTRADTTGFFASASMTIASSTDTSAQGTRSLLVQWVGTVAASAGYVETDYYPVIPSLPYTARVGVRFSTGTSNFKVESRLVWFDANKSYITENVGSGVQPDFTFNVNPIVTATAPSNAAFVKMRLLNNIATTATTSAYADAWQVEQASSASPWVPGPGVPLVTVEALSRTTPLAGIGDAQMTLVQVG